ncbi:MAG: hypothetical protein GQ474_03800 [Sulfurimonas sp.]|nr:hypothetical protein [Sulfurimonas sp.]
MYKLLLTISLLTTSLFAQDGWYLGNTCESIKEFQMKTPLDLISVYKCKPNVGNHIEVSADSGLLAFDCTSSELNGYMNLVFGKERCVLIKQATKNKIKGK